MVHWIVLHVVLSDGTSNRTSNSTLDGSSYESSDGTLYDGFEHCLWWRDRESTKILD